jgi:signal transduction histidine kinase/CheY-like chemotaxis protein
MEFAERLLGRPVARKRAPMSLEPRRPVEEDGGVADPSAGESAGDGAHAIARLVQEIVETLDPAQVTDRVVSTVARLLHGRRAILYRLDPASGALISIATAGPGQPDGIIGQRLMPGEGAAGRAVAEDRPIWTSDITNDPRVVSAPWVRDRCRAEGLGAVIAVPLTIQAEKVGALVLADVTGRAFTEDESQLLVTFADLAALALGNANRYEERESRLRATEALLDVARATSSTLQLKQVLKIVAQRTAQALGASRCSINFLREGSLVPAMSQFADGHSDPALWARFKAMGSFRLEQLPANAEAIRTKRPIVIEDALGSALVAPSWRDAWGVRAALVVPMIRQDEVVGTLNLDHTDGPRTWTQAQIDLAMTIGNQAALAAENARLYEQVSEQLRDLNRTQGQLLEAGKLAAVGQLAAGVAHEVNNPLAVIVGQAQLLRLRSVDPEVLDKTGKILKSAERAARIVQGLQTFVHVEPARRSAVRLSDVIEHVLGLREQTLRVSGIRLHTEIAPVAAVWGDAQQLEQVVLNLLLNAEHALGRSEGERRIGLRLTGGETTARLAVSDTGPGIPLEVLPRVFEPFFTTKPVGQGSGLGLSICYGIVTAHGGRIWAESESGRGATLVVELPTERRPAGGEPVRTPPAVAASRGGHVLVIDDEEYVADTLRGLFESLGQTVTVALGGLPGSEALADPAAPYDMVTIDVKMPDLSGPKLWDRLVSAGSRLTERVVFVTGDTVDPDTQRFLDRTGRPALGKPVGLDDLAALLRNRR